MTTSAAADRCAGVLIGLAAGDRIGGPTRMALLAAESLLERRRFDSADILDRYRAWWSEGAFDTGPVADRVLELIESGVPAADAPLQVHSEFSGLTAGCNPVHRSVPLAMSRFIDNAELASCARAEARLTHFDPVAGEVAAFANGICRSLIRGMPWDMAIGAHVPWVDQNGPGGNGGFAPEVLRAAAYFVGGSASFAEVIERSVAFAGPANYCPVLAGAFAGARWGASFIASDLLSHVTGLSALRQSADALAAGW